jgi:acetyl-CoA acyltransferase
MSVYIAGIGMTKLGRHLDKSVKDLTREAVQTALADAGATMAQVEAAWFSNTRQGLMEGQNVIRGQCALRAMGFEQIPIVNVENACASSSTGLNQAFASIRAGLCDVALVVGAEKMNYPEKREQMFAAFRGGMDVSTAEQNELQLLALGEGMEPPPGTEQPAERSIFMDIYAAQARFHMKTFGTTARQIAAVAAKNHHHSTMNPLAQYQMDMSLEQVMADRMVSWPFTRAMCAPISDGAAALVVCSEKAMDRFNRQRAARVLASALVSGTNRAPEKTDRHIGRLAALKAYEQAGIGPGDVSVVEVHDATAFAEIQQVENLGLCRPGEGGPLTESGATRLGGKVPVNVSGGLLSKGHPVGATGAIQICELVTQLRGEAGARQVRRALIGVAENGGGFYGIEEAATVVTVLGRA